MNPYRLIVEPGCPDGSRPRTRAFSTAAAAHDALDALPESVRPYAEVRVDARAVGLPRTNHTARFPRVNRDGEPIA